MKTTDDKSTFRELAKLKFELLRKKNEILECFIPIIIKFLTNLNGTFYANCPFCSSDLQISWKVNFLFDFKKFLSAKIRKSDFGFLKNLATLVDGKIRPRG